MLSDRPAPCCWITGHRRTCRRSPIYRANGRQGSRPPSAARRCARHGFERQPHPWETGDRPLERPLRMHLLSSAVPVQPVRRSGALRPVGRERSQLDGWEGVLKPVVTRYRGKVSRIYFRADMRAVDQKLVADEPEGKADQDRREGRQPRPLYRLPDGGSGDPKKPLRRHPAAHRRTATAASHVNSMRRSVSRVLQNQQEKCVLTAKSSALSPFDLASACLGAVRRRAGGSQAEGSGLPGARNRRRLGVNRQQSGGCRLRGLNVVGGGKTCCWR